MGSFSLCPSGHKERGSRTGGLARGAQSDARRGHAGAAEGSGDLWYLPIEVQRIVANTLANLWRKFMEFPRLFAVQPLSEGEYKSAFVWARRAM